MAKIHGLAYLIIGIVISALSYYIDKNIKKGFSLFVYVGLLMIIIGVMKLAALYVKYKRETRETRQKPAYHAPLHHATRTYNALYCPRCGIASNPTDNFCYNCGQRIVHRR